MLHVGHLTTLEHCRAMVDRLVVGVPTDMVVLADKGEPPIITGIDRVRMLNALACVDAAILYYELEFLTHLNLIRPDVLFASETWGADERHKAAEQWVEQHGRRFVRLPYCREESSTAIKNRVWALKGK